MYFKFLIIKLHLFIHKFYTINIFPLLILYRIYNINWDMLSDFLTYYFCLRCMIIFNNIMSTIISLS